MPPNSSRDNAHGNILQISFAMGYPQPGAGYGAPLDLSPPRSGHYNADPPQAWLSKAPASPRRPGRPANLEPRVYNIWFRAAAAQRSVHIDEKGRERKLIS